MDIVADSGLLLVGGPMRSAAELLFSKQRKPTFDQIEQTGRSQCEVQVESRPLHQPVVNQFRLVRAVVVQDQVDVQVGRQILLDR